MALSLTTLWHTQRRLWGTDWAAVTALWGLGAAAWALWQWRAAPPLPLVGVLLLTLLLLLPVVRAALHTLAATEPTGPRGRAWLAWALAGVVVRPPLSVLWTGADVLAQVGTPVLLLAALAQLHPALIVFAIVPSLWRVRIVRAVTHPGD